MINIEELCGIIPVYKPQGWTSFDVVAKLRGVLRIKRLGHAGTLDPMATGVLPVFVGKATKACDILPESDKTYRAGFKLGVFADTQDCTGKVISESDKKVTLEELKGVTEMFVGDIMQIPPMYSAVKVGGKKLYELAREGKIVEREPKKRHIEFIEVSEYDEEKREGIMNVSVSKGTYIRTLINDIGEKLGCGGIMTSLERTSAAGFEVSQCVTIEQIIKAKEDEKISELIKPIDICFESAYDKVVLNEKCTALYKNGVKLRPEQAGIKSSFTETTIFRIYSFDNHFLGLATIIPQKNELKVFKNLC